MRTDSTGNLKWSIWYFDSTKLELKLRQQATVNSLRETKRGTIICAAGDDYPDNNGLPINNYAAYLELDSAGKILRKGEWDMITGYTISGFYIDEAAGGGYLFSGNRAVFFLDTAGRTIWEQSYSYMLEGVGSEIAHFVRAKFLRDNRMMVMGRIYEGNCWRFYQQLYYDVWWSQLFDDGTDMSRDTAGLQRGDDIAYDFTQLVNGNLVFIGRKYNTETNGGGLWVFVTDSTGRKRLWEKQTKIPYKGDDGEDLLPISVCATPDSGFTVVGQLQCSDENDGKNGFVAHFVPKVPLAVPNRNALPARSPGFKMISTGSKLTFFMNTGKALPEVVIYNASGKKIASCGQAVIRKTGNSLEWEFTGVARGVYTYKVSADGHVFTGNVVTGFN